MNQITITRSPDTHRQEEDFSLLPLKRFFHSPFTPVATDATNGMPRKAKFHVLHIRRSLLR